MIKKVTMYEAGDGTRFQYKELAEGYEDRQELMEYVNANPIGTPWEASVDGGDLQKWLMENPRVFIKLLPPEPVED